LRTHVKVNIGIAITMVAILVFVYTTVIPIAVIIVTAGVGMMIVMVYIGRNLEKKSISEERLRLIYDNMPMAVTIVNRDYGLSQCNQMAVDLFEMKNKEDFLKSIKARAPEKLRDGRNSWEARIEMYEQVFQQGFGVFDWETLLPSGEHLPLEFTIVRTDFQGAPHLIVFMRDLRNEIKAQEASIAKGNFLSNMSHEIRTPLNAIIGMVTIGKASLNIERKDYALGKIEKASAHLLGLVNDILDMSKIEANKLELFITEFSFDGLISQVMSVTEPLVGKKNQHLGLDFDSKIPTFFMGDDQRLAQIITNLLSNAVKFTPEGGEINLRIRFVKDMGSSCVIQVEVSDTGIGIAENAGGRIFIPFEQAERGTGRKYGGTGLGLPISKRLVEMMGGNIWLESEIGKGAKFFFTVCLDYVSGGVAVKESEALPNFEGKCALLAEDIEINREIVISLLEMVGMKVECAVDGLQAVEMFKTRPRQYDIIFMDVQMPLLDGCGATQQIRLLNDDWAKDVPIIALTANVFKESVERCIQVGMNSHLSKPINFDGLINVLRRYLDK